MKLTLTREDMNKLGQDEKAAIIDALVVAVLADGVASPVEVARFDAEVAEVPWELDQHTVVGLIRSARERVGALKGDEGIALVKSIAEKLPSEEIREKVLRMMISVMLADGRPAKQEQQVGGVFAAAFQLSPESLRRIGADARNEAPAAPPAAAPAATAPATAPGYRWETEKTANVMFEVPTDWSRAARDNVLVVKSDKHGSGIELVAITGGPLEADTDQKIIMAELGKVLADPRITRAPKRLEQNGLKGFGLAGTGQKNGRQVEWFAVSLGDGKTKGVLTVGFVEVEHIQDQKEAVVRIMSSIRPVSSTAAAK